jgi:hypothetical protein
MNATTTDFCLRSVSTEALVDGKKFPIQRMKLKVLLHPPPQSLCPNGVSSFVSVHVFYFTQAAFSDLA